LAEVAVMIADGGEAIADLAVLRNQPGLFGLVASSATCWRVLDAVDAEMLAALKQARAAARERAWLLRGEAGRELPSVICGGRAQPGLVIDIDATLVTCHSEREGTAATYKHGFGYHPMLAWLDNTGEALAGMLRPGNATANDAADHATVIDDALAQIPDGHRHGTPILAAPTVPAAPEGSSAISAACVTSADWTCRSRSVSASPTPCPMRSGCCRRRPGRSRSIPTGHHGRSTTPGCRSLRSPNSPACLAIP
jgi:Transposase DDE domain group 1